MPVEALWQTLLHCLFFLLQLHVPGSQIRNQFKTPSLNGSILNLVKGSVTELANPIDNAFKFRPAWFFHSLNPTESPGNRVSDQIRDLYSRCEIAMNKEGFRDYLS